MVTHVAKVYHNRTKHPPTDTTNFALFGKGFDFQNNWSNATDYKVGQVVTVNGQSYVAIVDSLSTDFTVTETSNSTNKFTVADTTGIAVGQSVYFSGAVYGNVNEGATYYIKTVDDATTFTILTTHGGTVFTPTLGTGPNDCKNCSPPQLNPNYWNKLSQRILLGWYMAR